MSDPKEELIAQMKELIKAQQKHINDLRTVLEDKQNHPKVKKPLDPSGGKC